jgi:hypothetical protein
MIPKGILGWSHEVSVVQRDALNEQIRRDAKIVMPEEQIPQAKLPLTHQAALKSPLVAVSSRLTQKLVDAGIRVHTVGADRVTSSFYYLAEGGTEEPIRVEGDLVAAVGAMLGERADNAAIERVLDSLVDRLLRSLSKDRVQELSLELAAALPRASADGRGTQDVDLDTFEAELAKLVGGSEKYTAFLQEIAAKITGTNERRVDIPLFGDARKVSQGPFELTVGQQKVGLVTHERWLATGPLTEPSARQVAPAPVPTPAPVQKTPEPKPVERKAEPAKAATPKPTPVVASTPVVAAAPSPAPAAVTPTNIKPLAAPLNPPRPGSNPPPSPAPAAAATPAPAAKEEPAPAPPKEEPAPAPEPVKKAVSERPKAAPVAETPKAAPAPSPAPAKVAAKHESSPPPSVHSHDLETTRKLKRNEKGFPWLWVLVLLAAAFAAYRLFLAGH